MINYYSTLEELQEARGQYEGALFNSGLHYGSTRIFFADEHHSVFTEQWSTEGRFRGWIEEVLPEEEYFKRKLALK